MHTIGVGGRFLWLEMNIFKQNNLKTKKYIKNLPLVNNLQKSSCTQKYGHVCNFSLKGIA
jgi:hypothetical protein